MTIAYLVSVAAVITGSVARLSWVTSPRKAHERLAAAEVRQLDDEYRELCSHE